MYATGIQAKSQKDKYESPNPRRAHTIMSADDVAAGKKSRWYELEITGPIRNVSPQLWQLRHLTSLYLNDNNLIELPAEVEQLTNLVYLDLSNNRLQYLPAEIGEMVLLRELLLSHNHLRDLPFELGKLFQLQTLGLKGNPLIMPLLDLLNEPSGTQKLLMYLLDNLAVTASQPPPRPWIQLTHIDTKHPVAVYMVMCYNVLCDKYATRQLYGYCPSWALHWDYRKKAILEEIRQYNADIVSLQEVETEQFYKFFLPELKKDGYHGIFSPKSRARTMSEAERKHVDGCAIFFRTSKFSLVKEHLVEFNQLAMASAEGSHDMINRVMTKDNIGLAALLETKEEVWENGQPQESQVRQPLLVATCHVHWDPEYCDVKLIQTMILMSELKNIIEESQRSFRPGSSAPACSNIPLILCGDFNSLPDSGVVEFLNSSRVAANHEDFKDLGYEDCLRKLSTSDNKDMFTHGFNLMLAYAKELMPYTNYTFDFKGVIDYVFLSREFMRPLGVLGPLDQEWYRNNKILGCPHPHVPSDHLSLLVEIEMRPGPTVLSGSTGNSKNGKNTGSHNSSSSSNSTNNSGGGGGSNNGSTGAKGSNFYVRR